MAQSTSTAKRRPLNVILPSATSSFLYFSHLSHFFTFHFCDSIYLFLDIINIIEFECFPKLPLELQTHVWKLALKDREARILELLLVEITPDGIIPFVLEESRVSIVNFYIYLHIITNNFQNNFDRRLLYIIQRITKIKDVIRPSILSLLHACHQSCLHSQEIIKILALKNCRIKNAIHFCLKIANFGRTIRTRIWNGHILL